MALNDDIEKLFKDVASYLKLGYTKTKFKREIGYDLFKEEKRLASFSILIDTKGKVNILVRTSDMKQMIESWGTYKPDELADKAKFNIITKLNELLSKNR